MILTISKLKSFGVFRDYKPAKNLNSFEKFNLFYGWNGSGKTTLSKLFWSLSQKEIHHHFKECEFTVSSSAFPDVNHKNIANNDFNIRVFNKDFIERNVNFEDSKANSILILSEEKKEEMEKYKLYTAQLVGVKKSYDTDSLSYNKDVENFNKNLSKWASKIKQSFELIETSNRHLLNYDRPKLTKFIQEHADIISTTEILSSNKVTELRHSIKPNKKQDIDLSKFSILDNSFLIDNLSEVISTLSESIASNQISRLVEYPDINSWVSAGLQIHHVHESVNCEFCNQKLPDNKLEELDKHFSNAYMDMMESLNLHKDFIQNVINQLNQEIPETINYYEEFHKDLSTSKSSLSISASSCRELFEDLFKKINTKISNPFNIINYSNNKIDGILDAFNNDLNIIIDISQKHNSKNSSFDEALKAAQDALELHFVSKTLSDEGFESLKKNIEDKRIAIKTKKAELTSTEDKVKEFESKLLNEAIGAENFNKSLAKFIGRSDIKLAFDKELKGYKLIRGNSTAKAGNLSEGERTAIAFVYFVAKLKENGNSIEKTTIVVDDPISSFDSNHLFHSYSYLKLECEKAEQLFILTHNFNYFKLVRDWLIKKNERKKQADGTYIEKNRARFYSIDCSNEPERKSAINNANPTLLEYNSEYHYIFYKLDCLAELNELDLEKAFLISNLSRKLLEGFLSFKFPRGRNDFNQLLEAGCKDQELREKVYRFINKYSHNQTIEFSDSSIDNLLGEGSNIVRDVFKIMEDLDANHYREMKALITN